MKNQNAFLRKLGRGSASVGIAAAVIAAVILLNVLVTSLCSGQLWFMDLTSESMYTLTEPAERLLTTTLDEINGNRDEKDPVEVEIIFCTDPDILVGNEYTRYIYYTARAMEKIYPESVKVRTVNVWKNPSAVDDYRADSYSSIYQSHIIIASGTEFRIYTPAAFYIWDFTGYYGEQVMLQGILAVTQAESPICCITSNHGEPFSLDENGKIVTEYTAFLDVLENAGYEVRLLDLSKDEVPENCRLIVTFDPQQDFQSAFQNQGAVSEVQKLDRYLAADNAYIVFADADTPKLTNLEEYLETWGIVFTRYTDTATDSTGRLQVVDPSNQISADGSLFNSIYESEGVGGAITSDMRKQGGSPKVVFGNAASISYAPAYQQTYVLADENEGVGAFTYATYSGNNAPREMYDLFRADATSKAYGRVNGAPLLDAEGNPVVVDTYNPHAPYRLMTITRQSRVVSEGNGLISNINNATYVCAVASTDFASNSVLGTNAYGNTDALLSTLRQIGLDIRPVGIKVKPMAELTAGTDYYTQAGVSTVTAVLVVLPVAVLTLCGTVVLIRRKYRS